MHWRDSVNVLQDLSQFSKLYVKFHSCAWSPYGNGDEDEQENGCGVGGGDENWYMGKTQCYRANAMQPTPCVEAFTSAFGYVGVQNDSRRHLEDGDDADEGENDADNEDGDDVTQEEEEGDLEDVEEDDGDANQEEENGEDDNQDDAIEDEDEGDNENYAADDTDDANENDDDDSA